MSVAAGWGGGRWAGWRSATATRPGAGTAGWSSATGRSSGGCRPGTRSSTAGNITHQLAGHGVCRDGRLYLAPRAPRAYASNMRMFYTGPESELNFSFL